MKKNVFILIFILVIVYVVLSILGSGPEYAAEKLFYRAIKANEKIAANPDVVPPAMYVAVENDLKGVIEKYPKTKTAKAARMALAEFYLAHKKYRQAIEILNDVIGAQGQDASTLSKSHFLKGKAYEAQRQWNKALEEYTILRNKYKDTSLGFQIPLYIGDYYRKKNKDAAAAEAYNEAVSFYKMTEIENRGKAVGYLSATFLIQAYLNLEKYEEAGKVIEGVINNYPSDITYLQNLSKIELVFVEKLKNSNKAVEIYTDIMQKTKNDRLKKILEKRITQLKPEK